MADKYYCGPKGTPKLLRSDYFKDACKVHDVDYKEAIKPRKDVDNKFYSNMRKTADTKVRKLQAWLLFRLVRNFGWLFYGK